MQRKRAASALQVGLLMADDRWSVVARTIAGADH